MLTGFTSAPYSAESRRAGLGRADLGLELKAGTLSLLPFVPPEENLADFWPVPTKQHRKLN
jgi:hypothetical protein